MPPRAQRLVVILSILLLAAVGISWLIFFRTY